MAHRDNMVKGCDMLLHAWSHTASVVFADPAPASTGEADPTKGVASLIPYVTGASGALVVLLIVLWLFLTDKITTVAAVTRLRDADNNRFNDMVAQRDALVTSLEKANESLSVATRSAEQSLDLIRELLPEQQRASARRKTAI